MKTKLLLLVLFCFLTITFVEARDRNKVEREYRKRQASCLVEQERIQKPNIKHYKRLPKWCKTNGKNLHK